MRIRVPHFICILLQVVRTGWIRWLNRRVALGKLPYKENLSTACNIKLYRAIRLFILWELKRFRVPSISRECKSLKFLHKLYMVYKFLYKRPLFFLSIFCFQLFAQYNVTGINVKLLNCNKKLLFSNREKVRKIAIFIKYLLIVINFIYD